MTYQASLDTHIETYRDFEIWKGFYRHPTKGTVYFLYVGEPGSQLFTADDWLPLSEQKQQCYDWIDSKYPEPPPPNGNGEPPPPNGEAPPNLLIPGLILGGAVLASILVLTRKK